MADVQVTVLQSRYKPVYDGKFDDLLKQIDLKTK